MKKLISLFILVSGFNAAYSQCTPFLGGDKTICIGNAPVNFNDLYFTNATFVATVLTATDTIPGIGGAPNNVLQWASKTKLVATLPNGCKDSSTIRVRIRTYAVPDLGPDTTVNLFIQQEFTSILPIANGITFINGYNNHNWSTPTSGNVDTGKYLLTVITLDGCADDKVITVACAIKKDTVVKKCVGTERYDLTALFVKSGYNNVWKTIRFPQMDTVPTTNQASADTGRYLLFTSKAGRCTDIIFVKVDTFSRLNMGPDRRLVKCFGTGIDLTKEFNLVSLTTKWTVPDATKAPIGDHRLIATNSDGCKDTVFINVRDTAKPYIGPDENERICPTGNFINLTNNFQINALKAEWNTPEPTRVSDAGNYRVIATNGFGCKDTASFTIEHFDRPTFLNDTIVKICGGKVKDLNTIFNLGEDYALVDWSTANPGAAGAGDYKITIRNTFTECYFTANVTVEVLNSVVPNLDLCVFNMGNTSAFTTNHFRTAIIDKRGHVWAGTEDGGLYRFNPLVGTGCGGIWQKNNPISGIKAAINRYKDLQVSNIIGDTSIWAASQGHDHPRDITGGIDHVLNLNATLEHFGSVNVPASTQLGSRNVNSITIGNSGKIYAALGQSLTYDSTVSIILEGGLYHNSLINTSSGFTQFLPNLPLSDVRVTATGKRDPNKIWFAVDKACNTLSGGCATPYISEINDPSMLVTKTYNETNSVIPFDRPNLLVRSIFTASDGRTYVGLNSGVGIAVLEKDDGVTTPNWTLVNQSNSPILANTSVNFNAITEVNGEIWIGTTQGLLVYDGVGPLTECASFTLYTMAQGLPSNNVTDVAFDSVNYNLWITTQNGIAKIITNHSIVGTVYNVSAGSYTALRKSLKKIPLRDAKVFLFEKRNNLPDIIVDSKTTEIDGAFNFSNVTPLKSYYVDVRYKNNSYQYRYKNIKSNSIIGDVLIPDSIRSEMNTLMLVAAEHPIRFDQYNFKDITPIIAVGFDTTGYLKPFLYYNNHIIDTAHLTRIENVADYYLSIATIYGMAKNRIDLKAEQYSAILDAAHSVLAFTSFGAEFNRDNLFKKDDPRLAVITNFVKTLILEIKFAANKAYAASADENTKQEYGESIGYLNTIIDLSVNALNNGVSGTVLNELVEFAKKLILTIPTSISYETFCTEEHAYLIPTLATQASALESGKKYAIAYPKIYSLEDPIAPASPSINKQQTDIHDRAKESISLDKDAAKLADAVAGTTDAVAKYLQAEKRIALALKVFATIVKGLNTSLLMRASTTGRRSADSISVMSHYVNREAGFSSSMPIAALSRAYKILNTAVILDTLRARRTRYKLALDQLAPLYNAPYDSVNYFSKLKVFAREDSLLQEEINTVNSTVLPKIKDGIANINNFESQLDITVDTFVHRFFIDAVQFGIENVSYTLNPDSILLKQSLSSYTSGLKARIDSTVNNYEKLFTISSSINTPAYLLQTGFSLNFNNKPNSNGAVTYTLKNIGNATQNNVSALIEQPEGAFIITSPSFVNLGDFAPGQSKQLSYNFTSPATASMGTYFIKMFADNGTYTNISGILTAQASANNTAPISIKAGNWNDPKVWSTGQVPSSISAVIIRHNVTVNVDATVKSLRAESLAQVTMVAGKKLTVLQ